MAVTTSCALDSWIAELSMAAILVSKCGFAPTGEVAGSRADCDIRRCMTSACDSLRIVSGSAAVLVAGDAAEPASLCLGEPEFSVVDDFLGALSPAVSIEDPNVRRSASSIA